MGDNQGFDDTFNDKLFRATHYMSKRNNIPSQWPADATKMRSLVDYEKMESSHHKEDWHSAFMQKRPFAK